MSRRPAFRPRLEGIEPRLAPSAAPSSTAFYILPYIEQDNLYKQVNVSLSASSPGVTLSHEGFEIQ